MTGRPGPEPHDVIVVGGGPIGLATAWEAARTGARVLVLEQHGFANQSGGSSGDERHWRVQHHRRHVVDLARAARPLWHDLEERAGLRLVHETGSLWFGDVTVDPGDGTIRDAALAMDRMSVAYDWLTAPELERRFGFAHLPPGYEGYLQRDGGAIDVRSTIAVLHHLARVAGARLVGHTRVLDVVPDGDGVTVRTGHDRYRAGSVVLANGAGAGALVAAWGGGGLPLEIRELATVNYAVRQHRPGPQPFWTVVQPPTAEDANVFYGFPVNPWSAAREVRLGPDFAVAPLDGPAGATGSPDPRHVARVNEWVRTHQPLLDPEPVRTGTCVAIVPTRPGQDFCLGSARSLVPCGERVIVAAGGWAFKMTPLFGRVCAELALHGASDLDLRAYSPAGP